MPQNITTSAKSLVDAAEREIENLSVEDAIKLHGRDDVVLVDIRDPRELQRDGKVPGAFHCPRGMLEFWIDPASSYHKPKFAEDKRFVFFCAAGLRSALAAQAAPRMGPNPAAHIRGAWASSPSLTSAGVSAPGKPPAAGSRPPSRQSRSPDEQQRPERQRRAGR